MSSNNHGMGWRRDPVAVATTLRHLERTQEASPFASVSAAGLLQRADDDRPVLHWLAEAKARGEGAYRSWDQGQAGTCVSFGYGRGCNDLILMQGDPGADAATEPIYGGSRVEVGGGRISPGDDGSVGAWAARWVKEWGVLLRQTYLDKYDLTRYSESLSRQWGGRGVPDELEPIAREHPVKTVAIVRTITEAWRLLGEGYPIPVCSTVGFETPRVEGFCDPRGQWPHCMLLRGRLVAKRRGQKVRAVVVQNSWGGYLEGDPVVTGEDGGAVRLPEGAFCITTDVLGRILAELDSFALSDLVGFTPRELDWLF